MLISVIVPVYNVEKYLEQCIQSILNQTYANFELILINDGSRDNSLSICQKYAQQDARIVLIDKENEGVSSARNIGIDIAKGEWITFIDSDDYISPSYFDIELLNEEFDLILLNIKTENLYYKFEKLHKEQTTLNSFLSKRKLYHDYSGPCGKFYKSEIIHNYKLLFDEKISFGEDAVFNLEYIYYCNFFKIAENGYYVYRDLQNSLTKRTICVDEYSYLFKRLEAIMELFKGKGLYIEKNLDFILHKYFFAIVKSDLIYTQKKEELLYLIRRYRNILVEALKKDYCYKIKISKLLELKLDFVLLKLIIRKE
ncbi:glycosyltransferase family 2 protein [Chryseobacterium sp. T1]